MTPTTQRSETQEESRIEADPIPQTKSLPSPSESLASPYDEILRATRWWVLYGTGGFAVICILIGAVEALFGR